MTTTDDLKTALGAWVDETETNILGLKSGLGSVDATVSALQTELASEQADIANIKTDIASLKASVAALTPVPVEPPPPAPVPPPPPPPVTTPPGDQVILALTMPPDGVSVASDNLSAVITPADGSAPVTLKGSDAIDLGDITAPDYAIAQEHKRTVSPDGLYQVRWRSDVDGKRIEVSLQWGDASIPAPRTNLGFKVQWYAGTTLIGEGDFARAFWCSEERFATADRPDVISPAQAASQGLAPAYAANAATKATLPAAAPERTGPMTISDITGFMGQTGGRPDIGYFHERAAAFYATGDAAQRRSMRVWAEASNVGPWHIYAASGKAWDFEANPASSTYRGSNGSPPIYRMQTASDLKSTDPYTQNFLQPDNAHHPNLSFPEAVLTGDPWHYKELVMQTLFYLGGEHNDGGSFHAILQKQYGPKTFIVDLGSERGAAWTLRLIFCCWLLSQKINDPSLPSKDFWQMVMDRHRDVLIEYYVKNTEKRCAVFGVMPCTSAFSSWQTDYWNQTIGVIQRSGFFPDWQPIYDFCARNVQARRDPASGANINVPIWYYAFGAKVTFTPSPGNKGTIALTNLRHNGWPSNNPASSSQLGEAKLMMKDATTFTVTFQGGHVMTGVLGKQYGGTDPGKNWGLNFLSSGTPQPGDGGTITIEELQDWAELNAVNRDNIYWKEQWSGDPDYPGDYLAAMLAFAPACPSIAALIPAMASDTLTKSGHIDWKYSYAA